MDKLFVGDIVKLFGKTRHGKNRIRENGDMWRVITVDGADSPHIAILTNTILTMSGFSKQFNNITYK
jgi:hypothetical protein